MPYEGMTVSCIHVYHWVFTLIQISVAYFSCDIRFHFLFQPAGERDRSALNVSFNSSSLPRSQSGNGSVDNGEDGSDMANGAQSSQPRYNITNVTYQPEREYSISN